MANHMVVYNKNDENPNKLANEKNDRIAEHNSN